MSKITKVILKHGVMEVELNKVEEDEEKALLWELDDNSKVNTGLTFVLRNINIPVEAIYERETNRLLMFNINLEELCHHTKLLLEYKLEDDGEVLTAELDIENLDEQLKLVGIKALNEDALPVFGIPEYFYEDTYGNKGKVTLWLNKYGHRMNLLHLSFT